MSPKPRSARIVAADALGQRLGQAGQTEVLEVVAPILQFALETVSHNRGVARPWLVTRFKASVVWSSASKSVQSIATTICLRWPTTSRHPGREHVPDDDAVIAQQPVDLLDGVLVEPGRAPAPSAWPMTETASEALVMTPSAPLASDLMRLACRSSENVSFRKS